MKKTIKRLLGFYCISLCFMVMVCYADNAKAFSSNLKVLSGTTTQDTLTKTGIDNQVLYLTFVESNRNLEFKINSSTWQIINSPLNHAYDIHGGVFQKNIAINPGEKTLYMKTKTWYTDTTSVAGSWWMSKSDFLLAFPNIVPVTP